MLLQEGPAETFDFMVLAYTVILGTIAIFILSLRVRFRNLERDVDVLEQLEKKKNADR